MGAAMTAFILALIIMGHTTQRYVWRILPYSMRLAGLVMIAAGSYIIYWQVIVGWMGG